MRRPALPEVRIKEVDTLYEAEDYRTWLRTRYNERKKAQPHFSYRFMALKIGMDAGQLVKVLQGKLHLAPQKLPAVAKLFGLDARGLKFLEALLRFGKATGPDEIEKRWEELQSLKDVQSRELERDQYDYYSTWLPTAVRGLISLEGSDHSVGGIRDRILPHPTTEEVEKALALLSHLELIRPDSERRWLLAEKHIRTGTQWRERTVRNFQVDTMRLATEALDRIPPRRRDISTLTLTLAEKDLPLLRERVAELRRDLVHLAEESDPADSVYQVNIQVFPMSAEVAPTRRRRMKAT